MGLAWQQGPLATGRSVTSSHHNHYRNACCSLNHYSAGCGCGSGDQWVADSEDVVLLHEPGRYPVAYFA